MPETNPLPAGNLPGDNLDRLLAPNTEEPWFKTVYQTFWIGRIHLLSQKDYGQAGRG